MSFGPGDRHLVRDEHPHSLTLDLDRHDGRWSGGIVHVLGVEDFPRGECAAKILFVLEGRVLADGPSELRRTDSVLTLRPERNRGFRLSEFFPSDMFANICRTRDAACLWYVGKNA
jgi:hypothetical protein